MSRIIKNSRELCNLPAYRLEYEGEVTDCNGYGVVFRHIKSGARVCVISNVDENKLFSIGFRTPPVDDTGVTHIIEHTVLCGSKKFPVKDPFMELAKGSLNTFLNAMTFPDKTIYPVASCNDRDLTNLMDVYMDAVFNPNFYEHEEIFKQEGWHYELTSADEPVIINGIVYSEMKGAFSSPEEIQSRGINHSMFPDTPYGFESGGHPDHIYELTYEQYKAFHSTYYHPSNSFILLYGDLDIEERLEWLDKEYLHKYDVKPIDSSIRLQAPIGTLDVTENYPLGEDTPEENAAYLAWAFSVGAYDNIEDLMAIDSILDVLFNAPGAPIREALIKAGVGQDMGGYVADYFLQPFASVSVRNTEPDKMADFKRILTEELEKVLSEGINSDSLLATINHNEFKYCEADYGRMPKGLVRNIDMLSTWLYDDNKAFTGLSRRKIYPALREKIGTGYYENLIRKYFLNNDHQVFYTLAPKKGMAEEADNALKSMLSAYKASLSREQVEQLVRDTEALKAYQTREDTPEGLESIPQLERSDIKRQETPVINEETELDGIPVLLHDVETNDIVYIKFLYDMDMIEKEDVPYVGLATRLMGVMDTKRHSYLELDNEVNIHTGGISTDIVAFSKCSETDEYRPMLSVEGHVMPDEIDKCLDLIFEEIFETDYSSKVRMRELLAEAKAGMQSAFMSNGASVATARALASISSAAAYKELYSGIDYYRFNEEQLGRDDRGLDDTISKMLSALGRIFGSDNVMIDVTCKRKIWEKIKGSVAAFTKRFVDVRRTIGRDVKPGMLFEHIYANEGVKAPGEVNYCVSAGRIVGLTDELAGPLAVAKMILSKDYLYNNLRILGGAYGSSMYCTRCPSLGYVYSYRDPHLKESYDIYAKAAAFIESFDADEREMTKFVLGTIGASDVPLTPQGKGGRGLAVYMSGQTYEELQRIRDGVIDTTPDKIRECGKYIAQICESGNICTVGCERMIADNSDMFKTIRNLI